MARPGQLEPLGAAGRALFKKSLGAPLAQPGDRRRGPLGRVGRGLHLLALENGPATAAWVASRLSFIPFSFAAHAHDIYPPDGALLEKLTAATWVRAISEANRRYLASLAPGETGKIIKIPIGNPLVGASKPAVPLPTRPPYRLLALGRLVAKKGFASLIEACRILSAQGFEFHLTLAGDGPQRSHLSRVIRKARIESRVSLPGFVPHIGKVRNRSGSPISSSCPASSPHLEIGTASPRSSWRPCA